MLGIKRVEGWSELEGDMWRDVDSRDYVKNILIWQFIRYNFISMNRYCNPLGKIHFGNVHFFKPQNLQTFHFFMLELLVSLGLIVAFIL